MLLQQATLDEFCALWGLTGAFNPQPCVWTFEDHQRAMFVKGLPGFRQLAKWMRCAIFWDENMWFCSSRWSFQTDDHQHYQHFPSFPRHFDQIDQKLWGPPNNLDATRAFMWFPGDCFCRGLGCFGCFGWKMLRRRRWLPIIVAGGPDPCPIPPGYVTWMQGEQTVTWKQGLKQGLKQLESWSPVDFLRSFQIRNRCVTSNMSHGVVASPPGVFQGQNRARLWQLGLWTGTWKNGACGSAQKPPRLDKCIEYVYVYIYTVLYVHVYIYSIYRI